MDNMAPAQVKSGLAAINQAHLYYETGGQGRPFVMIHAGVADSRQWENEFHFFAAQYRAVRYDLRGYGKSEPVDGEFSHLQDLVALLDHLSIDQPCILMGCSMGGGLAMDFTLTFPARVKALIMVGSAPTGLKLDVPEPPGAEAAEQAYNAGDLDRVAELETQIWFDGQGRTPDQVDQKKRRLAYEMNRNALSLDARRLGKRLPDSPIPAVERLDELQLPVLVIAGAHDTPYLQAAADYMQSNLPAVQKVVMAGAAHLPNMDRPAEFRRIVTQFLDTLPV